MIIGDERAVYELWDELEPLMPRPRDDRPGQPVYAISAAPPSRRDGTAAGDVRTTSSSCCRPARRAHEEEIGVDPMAP